MTIAGASVVHPGAGLVVLGGWFVVASNGRGWT